MNNLTIRISFRVVHGPDHRGMSNPEFDTLAEAQEYVHDYRAGHPDRVGMSDESRDYWRNVGAAMSIARVYEIVEPLANVL